MIDRSLLHFCLRPKTLWVAAIISGVLFAILPVCALVCWQAGWIACLACWVVVCLMGLFSYGVFLAGAVSILVGGFVVAVDKRQEGWRWVCGGVLGCIGGLVFCFVFQDWYAPVRGAADFAVDRCTKGALVLLDLFFGYQVYIWSWIVLSATLFAATAVLATIAMCRAEPLAKLVLGKVRYSCPCCYHSQVPHCRCRRCSDVVVDLRPTPYGVWRARCTGCSALLPTLDLGGRLDLDLLCANCGEGFTHRGFGRQDEVHVGLWGVSSSGKTHLLTAALWQIETSFAPAHGFRLRWAPPDGPSFRQQVARLQSGQPLPPTPSLGAVRAINLSVEHDSNPGCLLYLHDLSGTCLENAEELASHLYFACLDGLILVVDPFLEGELLRETAALSGDECRRVAPPRANAAEVVGILIDYLERALNLSPNEVIPLRVALVLGKVDGTELARGPAPKGGKPLQSLVGLAAAEERDTSLDVRRFLADLGLNNLLGVLDSRFSEVAYFAASTSDPAPRAGGRTVFQPRGAAGPFLWVLHRAGVFSRTSTVYRRLGNAWQFCGRALHGREGRGVQLIAWLVTLVVVAFCSFMGL
jgi:hypothetical protein